MTKRWAQTMYFVQFLDNFFRSLRILSKKYFAGGNLITSWSALFAAAAMTAFAATLLHLSPFCPHNWTQETHGFGFDLGLIELA